MAIAAPIAQHLRAASLFDVDPDLAERLEDLVADLVREVAAPVEQAA